MYQIVLIQVLNAKISVWNFSDRLIIQLIEFSLVCLLSTISYFHRFLDGPIIEVLHSEFCPRASSTDDPDSIWIDK